MCSLRRTTSAVELAKANLLSASQAALSPQAARRRHASLRADATASTWVPPVVPVRVGPHAKRRRRDTMTSQFAESDVASGDSYHTPNWAIYYALADDRSLASADVQLGGLQSQPATSSPEQMGTGNSRAEGGVLEAILYYNVVPEACLKF